MAPAFSLSIISSYLLFSFSERRKYRAMHRKRYILSLHKGVATMFDILYQYDDFIVINKHQGISVHKDDGDTMLLCEVARAIKCDKLYLVHRLDKMTSGLLLLAKHSHAAKQLSELFATRKIEKYYLAIGESKPKKKQGSIIGDMERSRRASWKLLKSNVNPAITQFFSQAGQQGERWFICKPYTGKTHQIRVALNSIGSPILGDPIYNTKSKTDRGYLHAYAMRFRLDGMDYSFISHPTDGEKWLSSEAQKCISQWDKPWQLDWPKIK